MPPISKVPAATPIRWRMHAHWATLPIALAWLLMLWVPAASHAQGRGRAERATGAIFHDAFTHLTPFDADLRRRCTCTDSAFALLPRVRTFDDAFSSQISPLTTPPEVARTLRDLARRELNDPVIRQERGWLLARALMAAGGSTAAQSNARVRTAVQLYLRLAEQGESVAQEDLAYLYAVGLGVPRDDAWAAYWFEQAALGGSQHARLALAAMYALGRGVARDERLAASWILASNNDHLKGDLYACGMGVEPDLEVARAFYEQAAANGRIDAAYQLGTMYVNACAVPLDDGKARELFERAAHSGHPEAQIALSEMERLGLGPATPTPVSAYLWATYALHRLPATSPSRGRALLARDAAFAELSDDQRMEAAWLRQTMLDALEQSQAESLRMFRHLALDASPSPAR